MTRSAGYAYPWDHLGDPAAASRAATLGLDAVAVAACYHATRAATPLHPDRRIFEAEHAACYVPVREQAWRGHRLVPALPAWDLDGDSFGSACRQLTAEGLQAEAWIVLTHNSALGRGHPDLVVRNAFGDVYPYALCPAAQDVQEYCLTLVEELSDRVRSRASRWKPAGRWASSMPAGMTRSSSRNGTRRAWRCCRCASA